MTPSDPSQPASEAPAAAKKLAKILSRASRDKSAPDEATLQFAAQVVAGKSEKKLEPGPPPEKERRPWRLKLALAVAMIVPSWYFIWNHFRTPSIAFAFKANRPMLDRAPGEYKAADVGLRFMPPPKWSMQLTSNEDPENPLKERIVTKFKRVVDKAPAAWFRVTVVTADDAEDINETVRKRSPGKGWKAAGSVEGFSLSGFPAAKMHYSGMYNGERSIRELTGVRRGNRVFYFTITYQVADRAAQEEARQALQTVLLDGH